MQSFESLNADNLYEIRDLSVDYRTRLGTVSAVDRVSLDIKVGEVLGLVGESGCGKSTLGKALMRMIQPPGEISGGELWFGQQDLITLPEREMRAVRGRSISMIFQDPMTSLNPVQRIMDHLTEAVVEHGGSTSRASVQDRARALIERLGIQQRRLEDYPHQLSGGMRQRVMIGLGLIMNAELIIADEATTSLDVIVEAKLVDQLKDIQETFGLSILLITHNIALVAQIADRIAVMYAGRIVEIGSVYDVFDDPKHPYTQGLLRSVPTIRLEEREELFKMPGEPPDLTNPPAGCRFHPRCPHVMDVCREVEPAFMEVTQGRKVHCWLFQEPPPGYSSSEGVAS